jgi:hypothetical protein
MQIKFVGDGRKPSRRQVCNHALRQRAEPAPAGGKTIVSSACRNATEDASFKQVMSNQPIEPVAQ